MEVWKCVLVFLQTNRINSQHNCFRGGLRFEGGSSLTLYLEFEIDLHNHVGVDPKIVTFTLFHCGMVVFCHYSHVALFF